MTDLFADIGAGLATALTLNNLFYSLVGVTLGTFVGVLPGISGLVALSLLFPFTFNLEPTAALIMLGGIAYGTSYGGSTTSILLNVPGSTSSAVTAIEGYQMAKQGRAGVALFVAAVVSFIGGSIGIVLMMLFSPLLAEYAIRFGPAEYFSLMVMGMVGASAISTGSPLKGIGAVIIGICFGLVGIDTISGEVRFAFGIEEMWDGIGITAVAMGLFGVTEVISSVKSKPLPDGVNRGWISFRSMIPRREDISRSWGPALRGAGLGSFVGALPGTGATIASFMSYAVEKRLGNRNSQFGRGAVEGVAGPESANNAADITAFIPTLTLGIPGSASMAIMLGVLLIHGITPGPSFIVNRPEMFWGLVMSFWIGNILLLILNLPLIGIWVKMLSIPYNFLYPAILAFICAGVYTVSNTSVEVWLVAFFGAVGYILRLLNFPIAPIILGFILGPLLEQHFRRALIISRGDFWFFVEQPISGTILFMTLMLLVWVTFASWRRRGAGLAGEEET